ncbi:unnamed protein product [Prorocentrum cordatum]|nr:unnamed protein product [Polarella glacialis]
MFLSGTNEAGPAVAAQELRLDACSQQLRAYLADLPRLREALRDPVAALESRLRAARAAERRLSRLRRSRSAAPSAGDKSMKADNQLVKAPAAVGGKGSATEPTPLAKLEAATLVAEDPALRSALQAQIDKLKQAQGTSQSSDTSPDEAVKRASGAVRDATLKHDQAIQSLIKARNNLSRAEAREKETSLALARAERQKLTASKALAYIMGIAAPESGKEGFFGVCFDETFFQNIDGIPGITDTEKDELKEIERQLKGFKTQMETKNEEIMTWVNKKEQMQKQLHDRSLLKLNSSVKLIVLVKSSYRQRRRQRQPRRVGTSERFDVDYGF